MKKLVCIFFMVLSVVLLGGCGSASDPSVKKVDPNRVKIDSMNFSLIGGAKSKYQLDNGEVKASDILDEVGSSPSDLSNESNPISLKSGYFYNIDFDFKTTKAFPKGVNFAFIIVDEKHVENFTEDKYHKLIYYTNSGDISGAGEHSIEADVFISTDIPVGKYVLLAVAIDEDSKKIRNQEINLKKLPMLGSIYININKDSTAKRVELVDINGSKYIDLPYTGEVVDGYINKKAGHASLIMYNTSDKNETLTVSAQLELDNGNVVNLALLDTMDGSGIIKDEVAFILPVSENYMSEVKEMHFSYYVAENDYVDLVNSLPDLSIDENTDGLRGKVVWNIQSNNSEIITNDGENSLLLTKYLHNYTYDSMASVLKPNKELNLTAKIKPLNSDNKFPISANTNTYNIMDYIDNRPVVTAELLSNPDNNISKIAKLDAAYMYGGGNVFSGKNIVGYIDGKIQPWVKEAKEFFDYNFNKIDAAFKIENSIYLFRGDKVVIYDTITKITSDPVSIWGIDFVGYAIDSNRDDVISFFDRIDAATYHNNTIYFFSGDKYLSINHGIDLLYRYEIGNIATKFPAAADLKHITAAYSENGTIRFFNNLETKVAITKKHIFKYSGKLDEFLGKKKWGAIAIEGDYNLKGNWKVPGVEGSAKGNIVGYLGGKSHRLLVAEGEAEFNIFRKHPSLADIDGNVKGRVGGRLLLQIIKSEICNLGYFVDTDITHTLKIDEFVGAKNSRGITEDVEKLVGNVNEITNDVRRKIKELENYKVAIEDYNEHIKIIDITFAAGPVPINVKAGFGGDFKIGGNLNLDIFDFSVGPEVVTRVSALVWVEAGVDAYIISAKVGGDVRLIELVPTISLAGKLNIADSLSFNVNTHAGFVLNLIQARLYAKFKIDCWLCSYTEKFSIYESPWLFKRDFIIMDVEKDLINIPL